MSITLPWEKVQKLLPTPAAREIARVVGILSSTVILTPVYYHALQATKNKAVAVDHQMSLPHAGRMVLWWWCQHLASHNGKPVKVLNQVLSYTQTLLSLGREQVNCEESRSELLGPRKNSSFILIV